jgi:hypothetical protein
MGLIMKAIFGMHKGEFGDVQFSELVAEQLYRVSVSCGDERWVNPKLSRWKGHLILWVRQKNDEGYFPRKGWGFNLLFQPETEAEKKMLYEYQWTYSPAPNVISYLITPQWPNKVEPDVVWEKVRDGKLYSSTISDYQDDMKTKMKATAMENEKQRDTLKQFVPDQVDEIVPESDYDPMFNGEDLPSHEELQAEFNVDDD